MSRHLPALSFYTNSKGGRCLTIIGTEGKVGIRWGK